MRVLRKNSRIVAGLWIFGLLLGLCKLAQGWATFGTKWPSGNIVMYPQLGSSNGTLINGATSWGEVAEWAMSDWNPNVKNVQFVVVRNSNASINSGDGRSSIFWDSDDFGMSFGSATLAVTHRHFGFGGVMTEADIVFNNTKSWNAYSGNLRTASGGGWLNDFRRVAEHELGHVLGLDHPDEHGQNVEAQMNSSEGDLDHLSPDDIAGAQYLYGKPPAWYSRQLTSIPNAAVGNRTGAAHSSWWFYYYKGTDSNIWRTSWTGVQWEQAQLTSDGNVDDWLSFGTGYNMLCYKGMDNRLWELYWTGTAWVKVALGTSANVAGDVVMDNGWNFIYYRGTDSRVWAIWWTGAQWAQVSLGGTANVQGSLAVDGRYHFLYYQGSDNRLWCYYWSGTAWAQRQLSTTANVGGAVTADTGGLVVYYRSSADSSAWEVYWNGSAWVQVQIDTQAAISSTNSMIPYGQYTTLYIKNSGQCAVE